MNMRARLLGGGFDAARTAPRYTRRPGDMSIRRAIDSQVCDARHQTSARKRIPREGTPPIGLRSRRLDMSACANSRYIRSSASIGGSWPVSSSTSSTA